MKTTFLTLLFCILSYASAFSQQIEKIDVFENISCEDYLARMDAMIDTSTKETSSTIYMLIYEGKEQKYNSRKHKTELLAPNFGQAKAKINSMKKYISRQKLPAEKFKFIKAGFRKNLAVEIWLVPNGEAPPKPTPTVTKMKYRKGKASGFCTWCGC